LKGDKQDSSIINSKQILSIIFSLEIEMDPYDIFGFLVDLNSTYSLLQILFYKLLILSWLREKSLANLMCFFNALCVDSDNLAEWMWWWIDFGSHDP